VRTAEQRRSGIPLLERYTRDDLAVFSPDERTSLGIDDHADPQADAAVAWELLYRLEPELYDRLVSAERLHRGIVDWLPAHLDTIVEVAAGTGRLTVELLNRCDELVAIEPAAPLREILTRKLDARVNGSTASQAPRLRIMSGFFDALPQPDRSAGLVIASSALTPDRFHGGDRGLAEMERVCAQHGLVVIVWPDGLDWLAAHGYRYCAFAGDMAMEFSSLEDAVELSQIFYPDAVDAIRRRGSPRVPYELLGVNPPRDLAYKTIE
jgi:SAM-dependent methyltransferase